MKVARCLATLTLLLPVFTSAILNETEQHDVDEIAKQSSKPLPECAGLCYVQVLPEYSCPLADITCACPNANLTSALDACMASNCTIPNKLAGREFYSNSCGIIPQDHSFQVRRVTWSLFALAILFVIARFLARPERLKGSGYGVDDWTILACVVILIPVDALAQSMTNFGLGTDAYTNSVHDITEMLKQFYVFLILYTLLVFITKVSILQLYLRIWTEDATTRWFRRTCWVLILLQILTMFSYVISEIFMCKPIAYAWRWWDGLHLGHCVNREGQIYSLGAFNIAFDVLVFLLPIHNFLKLNISWRRKLGVCTIFTVGVFVTICSIVRLQYLVKVGISHNPTWDYTSAVLWSVVECNLAVVCTCMPATAGLLQRLYATISGKTMSASETSSKAPINPSMIDPENPLSSNDMIKMRQQDDMADDNMHEMSSQDSNAPTAVVRNHSGHPINHGDHPAFKEGYESGDEDSNGRKGHISLYHAPPDEMTATHLTYRDGHGRLHEVKVIDRPTDDVVDPSTVDPMTSRADAPDSSHGGHEEQDEHREEQMI